MALQWRMLKRVVVSLAQMSLTAKQSTKLLESEVQNFPFTSATPDSSPLFSGWSNGLTMSLSEHVDLPPLTHPDISTSSSHQACLVYFEKWSSFSCALLPYSRFAPLGYLYYFSVNNNSNINPLTR